ncbi:MAG: hypothetical protein JWM33_772, partial [Caulobacteraceae bacterium]|nr:hypothetical protein [Caulobacteraceae bacterium]
DGKTPRLGLSLAETQRYVAYQRRGALTQDSTGKNGFLGLSQIDALGADGADYLALNQSLLNALNAERGVTASTIVGRAGSPPIIQTPAIDGSVLSAMGQQQAEGSLSAIVLPNLSPP